MGWGGRDGRGSGWGDTCTQYLFFCVWLCSPNLWHLLQRPSLERYFVLARENSVGCMLSEN